MESGRFADELEAAAFHLTLLKVDALAEETRLPLATLARLLVEEAQEYLKTIENAGGCSVAFPADGVRQCGACIRGKMSPHTGPIFSELDKWYSMWYTLRSKRNCLPMPDSGALRTVSGVEMFINQAAMQFEYVTGVGATVETMRQVVLEKLEL